MKVNCIIVEEDGGEFVHIQDKTYNMFVTLCGFCDIPGEIKDVKLKPTCQACLELVRWCKSLHIPKGTKEVIR